MKKSACHKTILESWGKVKNFKKLEKKDFSLSDYDGYTTEEHTASMSVKTPVKATQEEVQPEQTGNVIRMFWR